METVAATIYGNVNYMGSDVSYSKNSHQGDFGGTAKDVNSPDSVGNPGGVTSNNDPEIKQTVFYRSIVVSLGMLCILLMAGIIGLGFGYGNVSKSFSAFQSKHSAEIQKLQSNYDNLVEERDQLQSVNDLVENYTKHGWIYFNSSVYYISTSYESWHRAREDCRERGADLVIIDSKEEQEYIIRFKVEFWIGLSRSRWWTDWRWVDGTPLTIGYWDNGSPPKDNQDKILCAWVLPKNYYIPEDIWSYSDCDDDFYSYVCEKNVFP